MDTFLQDIRYALRKLARSPGFTAIALTTLTLAIGATTAIFSVVDGILLRPLPFRDPARIVRVSSIGREGKPFPFSAPDFLDYRAQAKSFEAIAPYDRDNANLTGTGTQPLRLTTAKVGAQFFDVLGLGAERGRAFAKGEDATNGPRVVMLADAFWRSHFGADPRIVGQTVSLDGQPYAVVGIASPDARFPQGIDVFVPYQFQPYEITPDNRGAHSFHAIARLKPGVTVQQADAEMRAIGNRLAAQYPESNTNITGGAGLLQDDLVGDVRPALFAMLGAVGFVLLIACANVANLLLVRAAARESEIAVRTALGAGRGRIVRQLVTESLLLAIGGAVLGAALAAWVVDAVVAFGPRGLPRLAEVAVDGRVLLFTAAIAVVTGLLFGLVPALHMARPDISQMLRESVRGTTRGGTNRTRNALVVAEMALAVVLLVGAGLLIRSFARLTNVDPGFRPERVITFDVSLPSGTGDRYEYDREVRRFAYGVIDRLQRLPGSQSAGIAFGRAMNPSGHMRTSFEIDGTPRSTPKDRRLADVRLASPGYFRALVIPALRGRLFDESDDRPGAAPVVVVSQELARRYFPGENPIGRRITLGVTHDSAGPNTPVTLAGEIVGIVPDIKNDALTQQPAAAVYAPYGTFPIQFASFVVRSTADPSTLGTAVRAAVKEMDPEVPIFGLQTMEAAVAETVAQPRFYAILLGAFAGLALLLAALGIYGVISYVVSQRTRELGIRIALGASQQRVVRLVLGHGLWLTVGGVAIGVIAATWLTRAIRTLLYGVGATDPLTFAGVPLVLLAVAILASWLPARRAARVDPVVTMRSE